MRIGRVVFGGRGRVVKPPSAPATEVNGQEKENSASIIPVAKAPETLEEKKEKIVTPVLSKLESNLKLIRKKFAIIDKAKDYKTIFYSVTCDGGDDSMLGERDSVKRRTR